MKKLNSIRNIVAVSSIFIAGCMSSMQPDNQTSHHNTLSIYVATNKAEGNSLLGFRRTKNGKFEKIGEFYSGGIGTGDLEIPALKKDSTHPLANGDDPLISGYGIIATDDKNFVLVVNAGDATVSSLKVNSNDSLTLINTVNAGDKFPISIANAGRHVVVASVGKDNNHGSVSTYLISSSGILSAVPGSRRDLKARPSTVAFTHDGRHLIVNELVTGKINVFALQGNLLSSEPVSVIDSPRADSRFQAIPVSFDVASGSKGDIILMSEARFLTPEFSLREDANVVPQTPKYSWQTGSLSSYLVTAKGSISLINGDVLTGSSVEGGEIANCWVALSPDHGTLWAANALSSSISSFSVSRDGYTRLKNATAFKSEPEQLFFSDLTVSDDGKNLFQLVGNNGQVMVFDIQNNDDLILKQTLTGLPKLGAYGLLVL
jgi:6-phosphogluconolactonase (cycloisomerase 2 family)